VNPSDTFGETTVSSSPILRPWDAASVSPMMTPSVAPGALASASSDPDTIAFEISVTRGSSAGSMPLISMNVSSRPATTIRPRPAIAGAAPATPGTIIRFSSSCIDPNGTPPSLCT